MVFTVLTIAGVINAMIFNVVVRLVVENVIHCEIATDVWESEACAIYVLFTSYAIVVHLKLNRALSKRSQAYFFHVQHQLCMYNQ